MYYLSDMHAHLVLSKSVKLQADKYLDHKQLLILGVLPILLFFKYNIILSLSCFKNNYR